MPKLIYSAITSLDGYVADEDGNFAWAEPDEEMHSFVNDRGRLGRRVSPLPDSRRGRRGEAGSTRPCLPEARAAGRAPFRQRRGVPPLPPRPHEVVGSNLAMTTPASPTGLDSSSRNGFVDSVSPKSRLPLPSTTGNTINRSSPTRSWSTSA